MNHLPTILAVVPMEAGVNFSGIKALIALVFGIAVMVAGFGVMSLGKKGNLKKSAEATGGIGLGVLVFAAGAAITVVMGAFTNALTFIFNG